MQNRKPKHRIPSTVVGRRRLLKLAKLLREDADNVTGIRFDFATWGELEDENAPMSCGTVACAMGLAAVSGAFKRCGLTYEQRAPMMRILIPGKADGGCGAAQVLFSLTEGEAGWLFTDQRGLRKITGAAGERAVAKRIEDFVGGHLRPQGV